MPLTSFTEHTVLVQFYNVVLSCGDSLPSLFSPLKKKKSWTKCIAFPDGLWSGFGRAYWVHLALFPGHCCFQGPFLLLQLLNLLVKLNAQSLLGHLAVVQRAKPGLTKCLSIFFLWSMLFSKWHLRALFFSCFCLCVLRNCGFWHSRQQFEPLGSWCPQGLPQLFFLDFSFSFWFPIPKDKSLFITSSTFSLPRTFW